MAFKFYPIAVLMSFVGLKALAEVSTVSSVDLERYLGKWYEVASIPQSFQSQCVGNTTAEYSKGDIERALLLRELLKRGYKISKISTFSKTKLQKLFSKTEAKLIPPQQDAPSKIAAHALQLAELQNWDELEGFIKGIKAKSACMIINEFFLPVLKIMSDKMREGLLSISQEHILSSLLKEKIYSCLMSFEKNKKVIKPSTGTPIRS